MSGPQFIVPHANGVPGGFPHGAMPELEQALLLVRVSTMKMLRLQLAIERRDRAVALQAVEDLMELDAWMAHSAGHNADEDLMEAIAQEADDQRDALLHEKFGLAAGMVKRPLREWAEPEPVAGPIDILGPADLIFEEEPVRRTRWWLVAASVLLLIGAVIGAAILLGWRPDEMLAPLLSQGGWR